MPGVKDWKHSSRNFPGSPEAVKTLPPNAGAMGSIPGQGTKVPHAKWCSQNLLLKIKKKSAVLSFRSSDIRIQKGFICDQLLRAALCSPQIHRLKS